MITLYCDPRARECQHFNEALNELSASHRMVGISDKAPGPVKSCGEQLPALLDGEEIFCGSKDVEQHLAGLRDCRPRQNKDPGESEIDEFMGEDWSSG